LRWRVARNIWVATLKVKVTTWLQQNRVRPITSLFEVEFYNYFTEMITILRRRVVRNIWVATLKVKVTAWPCSNIVYGISLCYLKSDFKTISQKWSPYWDEVSSAIFGLLPWSLRSQHDHAAKLCPAHNFVIWSWILKLSQKWSPYWDDVSHALFGSLPWRSRSRHDLAA